MTHITAGTGPSSMSTLAPVTTRTMSTVLQEMATPPPPPRTTLPLQLTTSRSQPSATISLPHMWHQSNLHMLSQPPTSRLQATASHRKPLQRLARSRKISKPQPPKIPNPVSSEDCDLLFLEHSPHQAEMACIYVFITNP